MCVVDLGGEISQYAIKAKADAVDPKIQVKFKQTQRVALSHSRLNKAYCHLNYS